MSQFYQTEKQVSKNEKQFYLWLTRVEGQGRHNDKQF